MNLSDKRKQFIGGKTKTKQKSFFLTSFPFNFFEVLIENKFIDKSTKLKQIFENISETFTFVQTEV